MHELPHHLDIATPDLIRARSLQKRTDTKFVMPRSLLPELWHMVGDDYLVLPTGEARVASYRTLYFDSPDFHCFLEHFRGRRPRYKVRVRNYVERQLSYIEVKAKTPRETTEKSRRLRTQDDFQMDADDRSFVDEHFPFSAGALRPQVNTDFKRITVVGRHVPERLTVDLDLTFSNATESHELGTLCIVEVKQARFAPRSPCFLALRKLRARRVSFSKYCAAAALLCPVPRRKHMLAKMKGILFQ